MSPDPGSVVDAVAERLLPLLGGLPDGGLVQAATSHPLRYRHPVVLGLRVTREQPGIVQAYRYEEWWVVTTPGDRGFGGPLELGPATHQALLEAGYGAERKQLNPRREYRAEIALAEAELTARLMARTLQLLGTRDAAAVTVEVDRPQGPPG